MKGLLLLNVFVFGFLVATRAKDNGITERISGNVDSASEKEFVFRVPFLEKFDMVQAFSICATTQVLEGPGQIKPTLSSLFTMSFQYQTKAAENASGSKAVFPVTVKAVDMENESPVEASLCYFLSPCDIWESYSKITDKNQLFSPQVHEVSLKMKVVKDSKIVYAVHVTFEASGVYIAKVTESGKVTNPPEFSVAVDKSISAKTYVPALATDKAFYDRSLQYVYGTVEQKFTRMSCSEKEKSADEKNLLGHIFEYKRKSVVLKSPQSINITIIETSKASNTRQSLIGSLLCLPVLVSTIVLLIGLN